MPVPHRKMIVKFYLGYEQISWMELKLGCKPAKCALYIKQKIFLGWIWTRFIFVQGQRSSCCYETTHKYFGSNCYSMFAYMCYLMNACLNPQVNCGIYCHNLASLHMSNPHCNSTWKRSCYSTGFQTVWNIERFYM